ncbi:selT/selW/selH selenoprotein domain [Campylobacter geochelonis]|uniref:SelT/selW/selH selenoprotein domain n=1 Tax=Campylobacter geochelonis TaxID=1780362 RepID=A0A128EGU4_9BACT|nr:selT/selW/selH selenoprotein domain [Campylobacter geochelonis]CZE49373.1 selT/selW/selH selenoprotein domain [Campylobacter geochelonis]CZE51458.1 selT/selW/selH selenoprotein domain [Campylobacter geochelonis]
MKEEILSKYPDANVELVLGSGGNFIVDVDGKVIFSKVELERPRFPAPNEILELMA